MPARAQHRAGQSRFGEHSALQATPVRTRVQPNCSSGVIMNYRLFGPSGLRVSELCLGTMTFGEDWVRGSSKDDARKIYDAFRVPGGNFIDTASVYIQRSIETFLG